MSAFQPTPLSDNLIRVKKNLVPFRRSTKLDIYLRYSEKNVSIVWHHLDNPIFSSVSF